MYHTELSRKGPGLLLRDIARGTDEQVAAVVAVIAEAAPDVIVLAGIDWDLEARALSALQARLAEVGHPLPHAFTARPNRAIDTGLDLNGNGRLGEPEDAQGYGEFTGMDGLAVLSRFPVLSGQVVDASRMLWSDLPGALLPWPGQPDGVEDIVRLSTTNHWLVPVETGAGRLTIGTFFAASPVFDGPEDRNGRRNHDEIMFWSLLLDGRTDLPAPDGLVIAGQVNLDPDRSEGRREAIRTLLDRPEVTDPLPRQVTVDWQRDDLEPMRVSYVLPTSAWRVTDAGIIGPTDLSKTASRHRLVWVDVERR